MRPLEIAISVSLLPSVLYLLSPSRADGILFLVFSSTALLLSVCHWLLEGFRWQMYPAYLLVAILMAYALSQWSLPPVLSFLTGLFALVCMVAAILLSTIFPVFKFPPPTGPHKIGTQVRYLIDASRMDPLAPNPPHGRELMIQLWYPADGSARGPTARYRDERSTTLRNARMAMVETHAVLTAPVSRAQDRYPVLLYLPSWTGLRTENTLQIEELASHGYVVVGIDHPSSSAITVFPDGRVVGTKLAGPDAFSSDAALANFIDVAKREAEIRTEDARFVLDTLGSLNTSDPDGLLTGRLDLSHVGILGFSFGGGVAARAAWLDRRFKAALDMDGMIVTDLFKSRALAQLFFMLEEPLLESEFAGDPKKRREIAFDHKQVEDMRRLLSQSGGYLMIIPGTRHNNFTDVPFYSPLRINSELGRADPEKTARTISDYGRAFFDKHLKGIQQELLSGSAPESRGVHFEVWNPPIGVQPAN
jgi:dienelactone hydrolase